MNRLLTATAVALTAGSIFMGVGDVRADDSKTKDGSGGAPDQSPYNDQCDAIRQAAIGNASAGGKSCMMITALGLAFVSFDEFGSPSQIEVRDEAAGEWNLFQTSRVRSPGKYGDHYHRAMTVFKTLSDHIIDAHPIPSIHWNVKIGDRVYYPIASIDINYDMESRYVRVEQRDENATWPNFDTDRCELWAKSAEGDTESALVSHSAWGGLSTDHKEIKAWWDGITKPPLNCGGYISVHADVTPFQSVFSRFGITKAALNSAVHQTYASVGAPDPAEDPGVSIFAGLAAAHSKRKSAQTDLSLMDFDFTPDQMDLLNDLGKAVWTSLGAGGAVGLATAETGPGALAAGGVTALIVFDVQAGYALHDYFGKQIQHWREEQKQRDEDIKNGKTPQSENEDDNPGKDLGPDGNGDEIQDMVAMVYNDAWDGDSPTNMDGSKDPSGGAWYGGDGSDLNIDPSNPGGDPWCPTGNCDNDPNGGGLGIAHHTARPIP